MSGQCNRLSIGLVESVVPGGVVAATYAMRSGQSVCAEDTATYKQRLAAGATLTPSESVCAADTTMKLRGEDGRILGVTLNQPSRFGGAQDIRSVGAPARVSLPASYYDEPEITELAGFGAFAVKEHKQTKPFEVMLAQKLQAGASTSGASASPILTRV